MSKSSAILPPLAAVEVWLAFDGRPRKPVAPRPAVGPVSSCSTALGEILAGLYTLPIVFVIAALASRRVKLLLAAAIGLASTVAIAPLAWSGDGTFAGFLLEQTVNGAWLAWHAIAVILAGLLFHNVIKRTVPDLFETGGRRAPFDYRQLFAVCFLLGPFFEAATGFGVGLIIVIPFLLRMGLDGGAAVIFGLFSQILVPWGAMAVGSTVGAGLAGLSTQEIGLYSAYLTAPLLLAYLAVFWWLAGQEGHAPGWAQRLDDVVWIALLAGAIVLVNRFVALEAAALLSCGGLLLVRQLRDQGLHGTGPGGLRAVLPYAALTLLVVATRTIGPLESLLKALGSYAPSAAVPEFAPAYHVSGLILLVALINAVANRLSAADWRTIGGTLWLSGRTPVLATLIFVVMGQVTAASGMAAEVMGALIGVVGAGAVLGSPAIAAMMGLLTGSNVAANAIAMPVQKSLAVQAGLPLTWVAGLQNTAGSNFTLISPIRIAMGAALVGAGGREGELFRRAMPIAAAALGVFLAAALALLLARLSGV